MLMDWLDCKFFTTLFVDGNHENFDRLYEYPVEEWHGGKVHKAPRERRGGLACKIAKWKTGVYRTLQKSKCVEMCRNV